MKKLAAILAVLFVFSARGDEQPAFASGSFASGSFADGSFGTGASVAVPSVIGEASLAAADAILVGVGLATGSTFSECSPVPANQITGQLPSAGTIVPLASTVDLIYSSGAACPSPSLLPRVRIGRGL